MINNLYGVLGSGKSACATAIGLHHIRRGGVVAANYSLKPDWSYQIAKRSPQAWFSSRRRADITMALHERWRVVDSIAAIKSVDLKGLCTGRLKYQPKRYQEGLGLLILDEAGMIFNSRDWRGNMPWIEFFSQSRKMMWDVLLIAHDIEMLDKQIRDFIEYRTIFRNLQHVRVPVLGVPLCPFPLFLSITKWSGTQIVIERKLNPLPLWAAELYDSRLVFSPDDWAKKDSVSTTCGAVVLEPHAPDRQPILGEEFADFLDSVSHLPGRGFPGSPA